MYKRVFSSFIPTRWCNGWRKFTTMLSSSIFRKKHQLRTPYLLLLLLRLLLLPWSQLLQPRLSPSLLPLSGTLLYLPSKRFDCLLIFLTIDMLDNNNTELLQLIVRSAVHLHLVQPPESVFLFELGMHVLK